MAFILRVGARNLPAAGDTVAVYDTGTTDLVTGLTTPDSSATPLSNPLTVPASGQYGFELPDNRRVDIYWPEDTSYLVEDVRVYDLTLGLGDLAYDSQQTTVKNISTEYTGVASNFTDRMVVCILPDETGDGSVPGATLPLTDFAEFQSFGICLEAINDGATGLVAHGQGIVIDGFTGLTAGEYYTAEADGSLAVVSEASPAELDAVAYKICAQAVSDTEIILKRYVKRSEFLGKYEAGESITAYRVVAQNPSDGLLYLSDPGIDWRQRYAIGIALDSGSASDEIEVIGTKGLYLAGFTGLTAGELYYMTTDGALTTTGTGTSLVVGQAYSTTVMRLIFRDLSVEGSGGGGTGDVVGPAGATSGSVAVFADATGKVIEEGPEIGTSATNLVQLDGSARLPAVDGSQLTNVTSTVTPDEVWVTGDGTIGDPVAIYSPTPAELEDWTGFASNNDVIVTYSQLNRTITLTGTVKAYYQGKEIAALVSGWTSAAHPESPTDTQFLYYNGTDFVWSSTPWEFKYLQIAAVVFAGSGDFLGAQREPHGFLQTKAHKSLHNRVGAGIINGGGILSDYTLNSTTAADRRPLVSETVIQDEDIETTVAALATESYAVGYLSGTDTFNIDSAQSDIIPLSTAQPYYNELSGGTYVQTLLPANQYTSVWVMAFPMAADTESQANRYLFLQGQSATSTEAAQEELFPADVSLGELSGLAPEAVFLAQIIVRYTAGNWRITKVLRKTGNRLSSSSGSYTFTASVEADEATITGDGTTGNKLALTSGALSGNSNGIVGVNAGETALEYKSASAVRSIINVADGATANTKATSTELDTGTDDVKFATALAIKNANNIPHAVPGTSGNILQSNGTAWASVANPAMKKSADSDFEMNNYKIYELKTASFNALISNTVTTSACTIDLSAGQFQYLNLDDDCAITFSNPTIGRWTIWIYQDATGGHAVTFTQSVLTPGGTAYTATTAGNSGDILTLVYDGTDYHIGASLDWQVPA